MSIDLKLFNLINGFSKKSKLLDFFAILFAKYVPYLMFVFLLFFSLVTSDVKIFIIPSISAIVARFFINEVIYFFYKRKRPAELLGIITLIKVPNHPSFPSGHAAAFFALSFSLIPYNFSLGIIFLLLSFFMGVARIFCGVHWPSDILAGSISGLFAFLLTGTVIS